MLRGLLGKQSVGGLIAAHALADWWLTVFSEPEREYMAGKYRPMGIPQGALVSGRMSDSGDVTTFLHELLTWFPAKSDAGICQRILAKMREERAMHPASGPGYYRGGHFTTWVPDVEAAHEAGDAEDEERLLLALVEATEQESRTAGCGVAPWYYERLAILYRGQRDYSKEVAILERFQRQRKAHGVGPDKLASRLDKARKLLTGIR